VVTPTAAAVLSRTAKEALANVAHHAEAKRVWVCLEETDGVAGPAVRLEVCDDGIGFPDPDDVRTPEGHLGLKLLCDRVAHLGGRVTFDNRPGGGARLEIVVPVDGGE
jgi:two-component system, NarL family, sensor kinase